MSGESWAGLYINQTDLAALVKSEKAKMLKGDLAFAEALLNLFDVFEPTRNITVPPGFH